MVCGVCRLAWLAQSMECVYTIWPSEWYSFVIHILGDQLLWFSFLFFSLAGGKGFLNELFEYDCTSNFRPWYHTECTLNSDICLQLASAGRCRRTRPCANVLLHCRRTCTSVPESATSSPIVMQNGFIPNIFTHTALSLGFSRLCRTAVTGPVRKMFCPF